MSNQLSFEINGRKADLPLYTGSEGETAIDISKLRSQTGTITLDPGYVNTGACTSGITFLNGEEGILRYRGYPIEQLAENSSFLEVSYLLIHGELPNAEQLEDFEGNITRHTMLHEDLRHIYQAFPKGAHRLMGKMPTIAGWAFKKNIGQPFIYPDNNLSYCANFLSMMFQVPAVDYEPAEEFVKALNVLFILHADHEQNCSTSTVRLVGSSQANLFASIASGIAALWGPLHGGANQAVLEMLMRIHNDGGNIDKYVDMAKDKDSGFRLMGFGHRVYKNFDPRATIIKSACDRVLNLLGVDDPLLDLARRLEEVALSDEYFVERKLYPNVDFYSGIIYRAIGIPENMFTVMFALGRLPGWIAQWKEMHQDPKTKIARPRQIYNGETARDYVPIEKRVAG